MSSTEDFATGTAQDPAATIARQAAEIAHLHGRLQNERFAEELTEALILAATTGTIGAPVGSDQLLELIVETAADVIPSRAAHLFLIEEEGDELIFEVAVGPHEAAVEEHRIPLGTGLAGLVAVGGQPMVVTNVEPGQHLAERVAAALGFVPKNILCAPLFFDDRVIGVLELLDRRGTSAYTSEDIEHLGLFARQAAVAIMQTRTHRNLAAMITDVLSALRDLPSERRQGLRDRAQAFAARIEEADDVSYREALALARLVQEIAWHGQSEYEMCRTILEGFAAYFRSRPRPTGDIRDLGGLT